MAKHEVHALARVSGGLVVCVLCGWEDRVQGLSSENRKARRDQMRKRFVAHLSGSRHLCHARAANRFAELTEDAFKGRRK